MLHSLVVPVPLNLMMKFSRNDFHLHNFFFSFFDIYFIVVVFDLVQPVQFMLESSPFEEQKESFFPCRMTFELMEFNGKLPHVPEQRMNNNNKKNVEDEINDNNITSHFLIMKNGHLHTIIFINAIIYIPKCNIVWLISFNMCVVVMVVSFILPVRLSHDFFFLLLFQLHSKSTTQLPYHIWTVIQLPLPTSFRIHAFKSMPKKKEKKKQPTNIQTHTFVIFSYNCAVIMFHHGLINYAVIPFCSRVLFRVSF